MDSPCCVINGYVNPSLAQDTGCVPSLDMPNSIHAEVQHIQFRAKSRPLSWQIRISKISSLDNVRVAYPTHFRIHTANEALYGFIRLKCQNTPANFQPTSL